MAQWNLSDHFRKVYSKITKNFKEADPVAAYHLFFSSRKAAAQKEELDHKEEWISNGHGKYSTLRSEKEFFDTGNKSKNFVVHFYRTSNRRCKIVDKHLSALATQHIETKFCKLDVKKARLLCAYLKIRVFPTIVICKEYEFVDYIIGFDELGGVDDFSTEMMEWRLAQSDVIHYFGDLIFPPDSEIGRRHRYFSELMQKAIADIWEDRGSNDINEGIDKDDTTEDVGRDGMDMGDASEDGGRDGMDMGDASEDGGRDDMDMGDASEDGGRDGMDMGDASEDGGRDGMDIGDASEDGGRDGMDMGDASEDGGRDGMDMGDASEDGGRDGMDMGDASEDGGRDGMDMGDASEDGGRDGMDMGDASEDFSSDSTSGYSTNSYFSIDFSTDNSTSGYSGTFYSTTEDSDSDE